MGVGGLNLYRSTGLHRWRFLFLWTGVQVGNDIIEGKIHGHNIPQLLKNKRSSILIK